MLATLPKSNSAHDAYFAAKADVEAGLGKEIPVHLRSPLYKGYKYPHAFENHYVKQQYLPDDIKNKKIITLVINVEWVNNEENNERDTLIGSGETEGNFLNLQFNARQYLGE